MTPIELDPEVVAFVEGHGVSMHAASRNAKHEANLSRGLGCRVSPDRKRLTVFLLASHSGDMLGDFRANGAIAVVITLPSTHRTVQLKGGDAAVEALRDDDYIRIARNREGFLRELTSIGFPDKFAKLLLAGERGDVVAVGFTITAAFNQTPGPTAGKPLGK